MSAMVAKVNEICQYFNVFFVIDYSQNKVVSMSHGFSIFENKVDDTSINFPMGLTETTPDNFVMSMGESDSKSILVSMTRAQINSLFVDSDDVDTYKLTTFVNNTAGAATQVYYP